MYDKLRAETEIILEKMGDPQPRPQPKNTPAAKKTGPGI
jgi:hypothetical protein